MTRITGYDSCGVPRVYGEHENNRDVAETRCKEQALEYVARRRDTGPLSKWVFMDDAKGWIDGQIPA